MDDHTTMLDSGEEPSGDANLLDPRWDEEREDGEFGWRRARLGRQCGSRQIGASLFALPSGRSTFPLHAHLANEEMLLVLAGRPTLVDRTGRRRLRPGEVIAFPAGLAGAHRIENEGEGEARLLIVSTMLAPEVNVMIEDDAYWVRDHAPGAEPDQDAVDVWLRRADRRDSA